MNEVIKQIKVNDVLLTVVDLYPYRYDYGKGKEVLKIRISEENHSFEEIKGLLKACIYPIEYLENDVLKNVYENYSVDFNCQYNNGIYSVEITRKSQQEQDIEALNGAILEIAELLGGE